MDNFNMSYGASGQILKVPQTKEDRDFLEAVDAKTRHELQQRYGFLTQQEWWCNTITDQYLRTLLKMLSDQLADPNTSSNGIDWYDLFTILVSVKKNSKAEKEGNLNLVYKTGIKVTKLIEEGDDPIPDSPVNCDDAYRTGNRVDDEFYISVDNTARYVVSTTNGITLAPSIKFGMPTAITYTFIKNIFIEMMYRFANSEKPAEGEEAIMTVNFNDLIEFQGSYKDGAINFYMHPGVESKLFIKNDGVTEDTMGV